jgi:hypothetical protein
VARRRRARDHRRLIGKHGRRRLFLLACITEAARSCGVVEIWHYPYLYYVGGTP